MRKAYMATKTKHNCELENLILIIDIHEEVNKREKTRLKAITEWAQSQGICSIEFAELFLCDYSLVGEFRNININLGIEYKSWDNFLSDPIDEMEEKILKSSELYSSVGFFLEEGNYTFRPKDDNFHCRLDWSEITRQSFRNKGIEEPDTKTLAAKSGLLDTMATNGIHVRTLRSDAQFPYELGALLVYLTTPHKLKIKKPDYETCLQAFYMDIPDIGIVRAKELMQHYPNPFWLISASEESLVQVLGRNTGLVVYQFLRNQTLMTDAWKNGYFQDGTKLNNPCGKRCEDANAYECRGSNCPQHPDNSLTQKNSVSEKTLSKTNDKGKLRSMPQARTGEPAKVGLPFDTNSDFKPKAQLKSQTPKQAAHMQFKREKAGFMSERNKEATKTFVESSDTSLSDECITVIQQGILTYLSGFPEGRTAQEICKHFDCDCNEDTETMLKQIKQLAWEGHITTLSQGLFVVSDSSYPQGDKLFSSNDTTPWSPCDNTPEDKSKGNKSQSIPEIQKAGKPSVGDSAIDSNQSSGVLGHVARALSHSTLATDTSQSSDEVLSPPISLSDDELQAKLPPSTKKSPVETPGVSDTILPASAHNITLKNAHNPDKCINSMKDAGITDVNNLRACLTQWFYESHTLQETVNRFKGWSGGSVKEDGGVVFNQIICMEKEGSIMRFPWKKGEDRYRNSVIADKELDVGV